MAPVPYKLQRNLKSFHPAATSLISPAFTAPHPPHYQYARSTSIVLYDANILGADMDEPQASELGDRPTNAARLGMPPPLELGEPLHLMLMSSSGKKKRGASVCPLCRTSRFD